MEDDMRNINLKHFNKAELLNMVGNNLEFVGVLTNTFFQGFYKYVENIRQAAIDQDQGALKLNAHSITGSSKSVCFEKMSVLALELENTEVSKLDIIKDLIEEMENEAEIIKDILNE